MLIKHEPILFEVLNLVRLLIIPNLRRTVWQIAACCMTVVLARTRLASSSLKLLRVSP